MKLDLRKLLMRAAATAVAGTMALSLSMPTLAATWNLSNGPVIIYRGEDGAGSWGTCVSQAGSSLKDDSIVIEGSWSGYDNGIYINASSGSIGSITLRDVSIQANSNAAVQLIGEAHRELNLILEGDNKLSGEYGAISTPGSLNISGSGTLTADNKTDRNGLTIIKASSVALKDSADVTLKEETAFSDENNFFSKPDNVSVEDAAKLTLIPQNGESTTEESYGITVKTKGQEFSVTSKNKNDIVGGGLVKLETDGDAYVLKATEYLSSSGDRGETDGELEVVVTNAQKEVDLNLEKGIGGSLTATGVRNVTLGSDSEPLAGTLPWGATITCSGTVAINKGLRKTLTYHQADHKKYIVKLGDEELEPQGGEYTYTEDPYNWDNPPSIIITPTDEYEEGYDPVIPGGDEGISGGSGAGDVGGAIAAVAIGGAALFGGYEIATRVILSQLLPEGAAIPKNQGELALLVWNNADRPEPDAEAPYADDTAKAMQWCVEQGYLDSTDASGWTPKLRVIEVWNKAFPKL